MLNCPVFVPDIPTRNALLTLDPIKNVKELHASSDLAFVGIGTLHNSVFVDRGILQPDDIESLRQAGAVGEIVGRFFDADGNECQTEYSNRVVSIELDEIKQIPEVVAIVAGGNKRTAAIHAAIQGNIIKSLVIDQAGAQALLATS